MQENSRGTQLVELSTSRQSKTCMAAMMQCRPRATNPA
jgi:hypothetical protein